jgi:undecaprenyl-diphosphatase
MGEPRKSGLGVLGPAVTVLLALLTFIVLAHFAVGANGLTDLDLQLSNELRGHASESPTAKQMFHWITTCGNTATLALLSLVVALLLSLQMLWRRRYQSLVAFWIIATLGVGMLNIELKNAFARPRPPGAPPEWGWSFPSGHSMGSFVVYGMLAYLIVLSVRRPLARNTAVAGLALLILAIGFSRVYLGAHFPSDVVGGFLAGTVWLTLCVGASEFTRRRPERMLAPASVEPSESASLA